MPFSDADRDILRRLAARCREIADSEANQIRKQRWTDLNDLKLSGPPLLLTSPEGAWTEITPTLPVECEDQTARNWERALRQRLYTHEVIQDDTASEPTFLIGRALQIGDYGVDFNQSHSDDAHGAYKDQPVLSNLDKDLEKLKFRTVAHDVAQSEATYELADSCFGDLLEIQFRGTSWWTCGLTWTAIRLWGLENLMLSMFDDPDGLHRLMSFLSDEMVNFITTFEREGLLGYNSNNGVGSGGLGFTTALPSRDRPADGPTKLKQLWGFAESQETVGVSPEMFGEFIYPHQAPLLEHFGLNYYGCCEPSESRWDYISKTPNLRGVSVSPWSDLATCAELYGRDYVYFRKPNPAPVCMGFDENVIREDFRAIMKHAGELNTAVILKDTHTVENDPARFARWVEIGREELGSM